jgi:hypothetical protein
MNATRIARRAAAVALATASLAAPLALTAPSASAYTIESISAMPTRPTVYQVSPYKTDIGTAVTGPMLQQRIFQSGPIVYRTIPLGAGIQTVYATYTVEKYSGGWTTYVKQNRSVTIPSTVNSVRMPSLDVAATTGSFRVRLALTWTNPVGTVVSRASFLMNQTGDYTCASQGSTCSVGYNSTYGGAWVTLS